MVREHPELYDVLEPVLKGGVDMDSITLADLEQELAMRQRKWEDKSIVRDIDQKLEEMRSERKRLQAKVTRERLKLHILKAAVHLILCGDAEAVRVWYEKWTATASRETT